MSSLTLGDDDDKEGLSDDTSTVSSTSSSRSSIASESSSHTEHSHTEHSAFTTKSCFASFSSRASSLQSKRVSFSNVQIRKYPMVLGDHPSCQEGAPVSIDWSFFDKDDHSLDEYESGRSANRRSSKNELVIGPNKRRQILMESGITDEKIWYAVMGVKRTQQGRKESLNCKQLKWEIKKDRFLSKIKKNDRGKNNLFPEATDKNRGTNANKNRRRRTSDGSKNSWTNRIANNARIKLPRGRASF